MQVNPLGTPLPPSKPAGNSAAKPAPSSTDSSASGAVSESNSFTPTGELAALLSAVRQAPEVRTDAIESVASRLASGELETPEAAADTARTLIQDIPPPPSE
jgi:hypothetical protein